MMLSRNRILMIGLLLLSLVFVAVGHADDGLAGGDDICALPADVGPCDGVFPRWFHNARTGQCEMFIYGGCEGNGNNFETLLECQQACVEVAVADRPCPPDIDCSGQVDVGDLVMVITGWGRSGGPADVNGSGAVEVGDLIEVINGWGTCLFQYGPADLDPEAEQIALEMLGPGGPLLADPDQYQRIDRDLDLIREAIPDLAGVTHTPEWAAIQIIVQLEEGAPQDAFDCLNTYHQAFTTPLFGNFQIVHLPGKVNVEALIGIYADAPEVVTASVDLLIGGPNSWTPTPQGDTWHWVIDHGYGDCPAGCLCHCIWTVETDLEGNVDLLSFLATCPDGGCEQ